LQTGTHVGFGNSVDERNSVLDIIIVYLTDHVATNDSSFLRRRTRRDVCNYRSSNAIELELLGNLSGHPLDGNSKVAANNPPLRDNAAHRRLDDIRGNREPDPLVAAGCGIDRRVDTDNLTANIHQGSSGVPRIDCRVGLEKFNLTIIYIAPVLGTDNSLA